MLTLNAAAAELARLREQEAGAAAMREALDIPVREAVQYLHEARLFVESVTLGSLRAKAMDHTAGRELVAEVERLRQENEEVKRNRKDWIDEMDKAVSDNVRLRASEERLLARLARIAELTDGGDGTADATPAQRLANEIHALAKVGAA